MDQFLLEKILETIPLKYYVINRKTKIIVKTNDNERENKNGICFSQIYNRNFPCNGEGDQCICERLLQTKNTAEFIAEIGQNKERQFFKIKAFKLTDDLVLETITDITNEKLLKKELKINEKRLEKAGKLADFGYWEFNLDNNTVLASHGARKIYGLQPDEELTIPEVQKIPLAEYRKKLDKSLNDLIHSNKPYDVKFEVKRKSDGEIRNVRSVAEYKKNKNMIFGVLHDTTETDLAQKELVKSERNLQLLFQHINSAFAYHKIITDENGVPVDYIFLDVNNKFEELTGLKRLEIIGKTVKVILPHTEDSWIQRFGNVALTGNPVKFSNYSEELDKYFEVSVYSPKRDFFAVTFTDVTQTIKSAKELSDTLEDLKLAQKIARLGNWQYDPNSKKTTWSEEVYKVIERDPSLPVFNQQEFQLFFGKNNYDEFRGLISRALSDGVPFQFQMEANVPKSKTKWIEIICVPDQEPGDNGYFLRGTIQDINRNKQIEVQLNNSNKLLRTVIDNIPDAVYMKDINYRKVVANKIDAKRSNLEIEEIIGKTDFEIYPEEIAKKYFDDDRKVIETGKPIYNREEISPDGDKISWLLTSKIPLKNDENKVIGLVGIGRDITEIKENEKRLRLLQQVIEQSPLSVVITDIQGNIEYVNPCFETTTGYSRDEAIGKTPGILNSGHQEKNFYEDLWSTILKGENWVGEFNNKRKDGTTYNESAIITPIIDESKKIIKFVAIKEDITNIKKMVKELEIAKEQAEESNRLKTVFLANMSHEIRTPLNGILGFSSIICSGLCNNDQLEKYGKIIENSGQRLITVIDDIMDISMIQANQLKVEFVEFDLINLLEEIYIVYKTQQQTELENIEFDLVVNISGTGKIISDKNRIYQIIKNLLDNAFKFTETGAIKFGCYAADSTQIVLFVEDSGIGIEADKLDLIFEIFRQAEEGSSRKYEGSGLGLAIVSGLIEKLGGEITVKSKINKGTTFYVTLPRNKMQPINQ
ncbi:MAG: PAS domain S-box protein [Prolixibacteraceae bacterium]|nr:PAS domain S-box protein [Prolixibacteraceae bacterium]